MLKSYNPIYQGKNNAKYCSNSRCFGRSDCSVRLEENLVVTKNGYQVFSLFPFEEEAVGFIEN
jgi:hypothetical protein